MDLSVKFISIWISFHAVKSRLLNSNILFLCQIYIIFCFQFQLRYLTTDFKTDGLQGFHGLSLFYQCVIYTVQNLYFSLNIFLCIRELITELVYNSSRVSDVFNQGHLCIPWSSATPNKILLHDRILNLQDIETF